MSDIVRSRLSAAGSVVLTPAGVIVCAALLWLGTAGLCIAMLLVSRTDAYNNAAQNARNLTLVLERDILRSIDLYDLSLRAVAEGAADARVISLPAGLRNQVLFDRAATARYLGPISVLGPDGALLISSDGTSARQSNWADMRWFSVRAQETRDGLYVGPPHVSGQTGHEMVVELSRRITRPDGTFAGVVVGRLSVDYFRDLLDGLSVGNFGTVAVMETNGALLTRLPYDRNMVGMYIGRSPVFAQLMKDTSGAFVGTASIDGVRRLYVYRHIPGLPIVVAVAPALNEIFAGWRLRARWLALLMALFIVATGTGAWTLVRELCRRQQAETQLQRMAHRDALTGLENRGTFDEIWKREWLRAQRTGKLLSLLFIDIDNFKAYNDYYGHQAGDQVLKEVARRTASCVVRAADHVARYGGEEFVVILPETDAGGAVCVAESIRRAIYDLEIEHVKSAFGRVTISIGVASSDEPGILDETALIKAADTALYRAKSQGRNCVCEHMTAIGIEAGSSSGMPEAHAPVV
ncbi:diguanylate cyclase [Paraburkholderia sp. MMS20-SJTN17]|uniref:diguanylate cyclase n=1 Tax=Paraburkholderia translucens TaxID=2886945 RepID=A0ABS8KBZ1_9BURK|nr:diguanylate cyclase [Paraburkholderia sp. MMS20-SJTN17]MCC8402289.1 diguanylate cyclase [Paraburkholderia sp. MMS20-SJTN17]